MNKKRSKLTSVFQIVLALCIILLSNSCRKTPSLNGTWVYKSTVLEFSNETVSFIPTGESFSYSIIDSEILLTERLRTPKKSKFESLKLPILLGKLSKKQDSLISKHFNFTFDSVSVFSKLMKNKSANRFEKIQLSSTYWSNGCNLEIDKNGNCVIQGSGFDDYYSCYSFELDSNNLSRFIKLSSKIELESIAPKYSISASDLNSYSTRIFLNDDTISTYNYGSAEHFSLLPMRYFLEELSYFSLKDTSKLRKTKKHFFESKLVQCQKDTTCIMAYNREFDTLNYHLPQLDKMNLKKLFNKYYNFSDDNICFRYWADSLGNIYKFEFNDTRINPKTGFLEEVKSKIKVKPAIYKGKQIPINVFECISYIED